MKKYQFYLGIGFAGVGHTEIVEVPDDITEEDLKNYFQDWVSNYLDACYFEVV